MESLKIIEMKFWRLLIIYVKVGKYTKIKK